jgi:mevalonate kinase
MKTMMFQTSAHAKCILVGEHAVLRGSPALVVPVTNRTLKLHYFEEETPLEMHINSPLEVICKICFYKVMKKAFQLLHHDIKRLRGRFQITNNIDLAAGLGFSAAICLAITKWLIWKNWLPQKKIFYFAKRLENIFHSRSSGIDIVGSLTNHLTYFQKMFNVHRVYVNWQPKFYISYSGAKKFTSDSVNKVSELNETSSLLAQKIDNQMRSSVVMLINALQLNEAHGFEQAALAIQNARQCFESWHLVSQTLAKHMQHLHELGCTACKPIGAGWGGFALSLWENEPPFGSEIEFIPIFNEL